MYEAYDNANTPQSVPFVCSCKQAGEGTCTRADVSFTFQDRCGKSQEAPKISTSNKQQQQQG